MDWKAYVSDCLISAGQDGREYRVKKAGGSWSAAVLDPGLDAPFSPVSTILETGLSLEAALGICKVYENREIEKSSAGCTQAKDNEKDSQYHDTTLGRVYQS